MIRSSDLCARPFTPCDFPTSSKSSQNQDLNFVLDDIDIFAIFVINEVPISLKNLRH